MKKKAIIFGTGTLAELVDFYLDNDSTYEVVAFCSTHPIEKIFCGKPLLHFESIENHYPPCDYDMFVAIGYRQMNGLRKQFCEEARAKGYDLLSYISSKATYWNKSNKIGDNVFIFEDNTIQPFVQIGDGTILWSGNHIGHHTRIGAYCFISSHVVISGECSIGDYSFLGVNSTIIDGIFVADHSLIGAGALITKDTVSEGVYVTEKAKKIKQSSHRFF